MLLPDVSSESNLNSLQTIGAGCSFFFYSSPKQTLSFSCLIWTRQEGQQHVCLQPDEPGVPSCHGALGKPFTDLAGSGGLSRQVFPRALTPTRVLTAYDGAVSGLEVPTASCPRQPLTHQLSLAATEKLPSLGF